MCACGNAAAAPVGLQKLCHSGLIPSSCRTDAAGRERVACVENASGSPVAEFEIEEARLKQFHGGKPEMQPGLTG